MKQGSIRHFFSATFLIVILPSKVFAAPVTYVDLALGVGVHVIDDSDQGAASELIKTGVGIQWLPFLSTQVGIWSWSSENQSKRDPNEDSERQNVGLFDGLSVSWEVAVQWPIENANSVLSSGPYYRYGRHCWSAVLTGLVQPWSKKGCSELNTLGFTFPTGSEEDVGLYIEFTQTDFDDLFSSSLQLGAKLAF
ncbi:MAG: hypothetical protein V7765_09690 [Oleispira sp.]